MKIKINQREKIVFFEVMYPTCLGIPHIMKKHFSGFSYQVLSHQKFHQLGFTPFKKGLK